MRSPRKFYLANAAGERWPLNGERGVWLADPSGLGLALTPGVANGRNGFFAVTVTDDVPQGGVYGTLVFTGSSPYTDYQTLLSWALAAADGLAIIYTPTPSAEYCRSVVLTSLVKSEIKAPGWLSCEMTLEALTPWYRASVPRIDIDNGNAATAKRYPYRYVSGLHYPVSSNGQMRAVVQASGHLPAAVTVDLHGPIDRPSLRLVGTSTGKEYARADIDVRVNANERLEYSSRYLNAYIQKVAANDVTTDLLPMVDLAYEPWLRVPLAEPCALVVAADSAVSSASTLNIYDYYWSV